MYDEFDLEQDIQSMREDFYARRMEQCCECGSRDTCCTAGVDAYCGDCWNARQQAKKARKAARDSALREG